MSRVEEAMRRAAEEARKHEPASGFPLSGPVPDRDPSTLAREPFPMEAPDLDRQRPGGLTTSPGVATARGMTIEDPEVRAVGAPPDEFDAKLAEKVVVDRQMMPVSREQYRRLAAVLHDAQASRGTRVLLIASAVAAEGKTLTAVNLALTLSESYHRQVLLVDADLRRPAVHQLFRIAASSGLSEGLDGASAESPLVVRQVRPNLAVLPAGRPIADPMSRLVSGRMRRLVDEAKERFDWVILDALPLMLLPDAHLLATMVDAAVLVIRAASTPHDLIKRTMDVIGRDRVLGAVLNRAAYTPAGSYDEYGQYAEPLTSLTTHR